MTIVAELVEDPAWLPEAFDPARDAIAFARIDRAGLAKEAFLDKRMAGSVTARATAPAGDIIAASARLPRRPPPAFIFHTAFCCSTLLARALDRPESALALKEPNILLDLANAARVDEQLKRDPARFQSLFRAVAALLARPHAGEERVVVKPTNTASTLLGSALAIGAPALLLYGQLRDFLISIIKKGEEGRAFVRLQYNIYALDGAGLAAIPPRQAMGFTDLQVAAVVWRHQIEQFARVLDGAPAARLASLDYRKLLEAPAAVLTSAADHLRLPLDEAALTAAAASDVFARNSKFADQKFDAAQRGADEAALAERWKSELDLIVRWAAGLNLGVEARLPLPRALSV
ncbi:MAG: hypothetical protein GC153_03545 [Alphaproteobacteria bacterium]|nr:hypothetical protein [Alphaproteobacteria bacterium]